MNASHNSGERRLTRNQGLVFDVLAASGGPLSAYEILDQLRDQGLRAPLQIYRALDKLRDMALVHRLESINAFVACAHPHSHGDRAMAFAICDACGKVFEFSDPVVESHLVTWASKVGFAAAKTTIEMRGTCADCAPA